MFCSHENNEIIIYWLLQICELHEIIRFALGSDEKVKKHIFNIIKTQNKTRTSAISRLQMRKIGRLGGDHIFWWKEVIKKVLKESWQQTQCHEKICDCTGNHLTQKLVRNCRLCITSTSCMYKHLEFYTKFQLLHKWWIEINSFVD